LKHRYKEERIFVVLLMLTKIDAVMNKIFWSIAGLKIKKILYILLCINTAFFLAYELMTLVNYLGILSRSSLSNFVIKGMYKLS